MHKLLLLVPLLLLIQLVVDRYRSMSASRPVGGASMTDAQKKVLLQYIAALVGLVSLAAYLYKDYKSGDFVM